MTIKLDRQTAAPDNSKAEPCTLERAEAIDRSASSLYRNVKQAHTEVERISAGAFPDLVQLAAAVLEPARAMSEQAAVVRMEEEEAAR